MRRRVFLTGLAAAGVSGCADPMLTATKPAATMDVAPSASASSAVRSVERVGLQLYTVRDLMARDVAATLAAVAEAGYLEVETAGTGDLSPVQFAQALSEVGLTAPAAHVPLNLLAEQPDQILRAAQSIGYQYVVVPWLPPEMRTLAGYTKVVEVLHEFGERSAREGIQTCYHNHDFEFASISGVVPMQFLLAECDRNLVRFELDLYWAAHAGADAAAYLSQDPLRFPLCHVKDRDAQGAMVDVGDGEIDFPALFAAGSGLKHYFVEHDQPKDSLRTVQNSISALRKMRF